MSIYNKIVFNGQTLIDLSNDTVDSSDDIVEGLVGHLNNGTSVTGTASGGGGGGSATDPVRFIDYDGTILYSYSSEDFAALTAMPANPTHTGLTAQGWNWTLADAKAQVTATGTCDIGQMYITDDGKTRIYISLTNSARLSPYLGICPNGTVVVDWGDNSATNTLTGTSLITVQRAQHTYASTGDYVITLTVTSGVCGFSGTTTSSNGSYLLTRTNGTISSQDCYQLAIKKIELGSNISLGAYSFYYCGSLVSITMPSTITVSHTNINNYTFSYCYSLKSITIPNTITYLGMSPFSSCYALTTISLPKNVSLSGNLFNSCYSLKRVTIPSGVTSLGESTFISCITLESCNISSSVTSIGQNSFSSCYTLTSIIIPNGVTTISKNIFQHCESLGSLTIPSGVTSINSGAFQYDSCIAEYHLLPTTPPTLESTTAFGNILADCKIYVPYSADHSILNAYQTATNWSTYASYMVEESS